ncbi:MAG: hypothetical protein CM15mP31_2100 [Gammaproteobacteria bacterium]|nr:MAG: hypothetical protein CM15mP31_2100 [Gammaproteobacteria bacterium]
MSTETTGHQKYYVPESSSIPIVFAIAMLFFGVGAADAVMGKGTTLLFIGVAAVVATLAYWWSVVIRESHAGLDTPQLNTSYVYGMAWFIFSEVMFLQHSLVLSSISELFQFHGWAEKEIRGLLENYYGQILWQHGRHGYT